MIKKIGWAILAFVAVSMASATSVVLVSYYAYYPEAGNTSDSLYISSSCTFTVEVTGVGGGSGNGHVYNPSGGGLLVSTGAGGGAGQPFYSSVTSGTVPAGTYSGYASGSTWSSGAYAITKVIANW